MRLKTNIPAGKSRSLNKAFRADVSTDPNVKVFSFIAGKDRGYRVQIDGNERTVRVPPRGVEIVRVATG